jgi:hypothetical protein
MAAGLDAAKGEQTLLRSALVRPIMLNIEVEHAHDGGVIHND